MPVAAAAVVVVVVVLVVVVVVNISKRPSSVLAATSITNIDYCNSTLVFC